MSGIHWPNHAWDEIVENLWQGGLHYRPRLGDVEDVIPRDEFHLVVSMAHRSNTGPDKGIPHWRSWIPDGALNAEERTAVDGAVERTLKALEAGERVLVRCRMGLNRSGLVVALVLLALGHTADDAIDLIRAKRSEDALCNKHFVRYIHERAAVANG
jgi:hypothetical protein